MKVRFLLKPEALKNAREIEYFVETDNYKTAERLAVYQAKVDKVDLSIYKACAITQEPVIKNRRYQ